MYWGAVRELHCLVACSLLFSWVVLALRLASPLFGGLLYVSHEAGFGVWGRGGGVGGGDGESQGLEGGRGFVGVSKKKPSHLSVAAALEEYPPGQYTISGASQKAEEFRIRLFVYPAGYNVEVPDMYACIYVEMLPPLSLRTSGRPWACKDVRIQIDVLDDFGDVAARCTTLFSLG